jgi:malonyl CoA-acyl carrier protein transacylase
MSSGLPELGPHGSGVGRGTLALFPGMAAGLACTAGEDELYCHRHWELGVVATEAAAPELWRSAGHDVAASLGFSISAYAAVLAAGTVNLAQVVGMIDTVLEAPLRLQGRFSMLAVAGAPIEEVTALCRAGEVELAAVIVPGQLLIAGEESAVAEFAEAVAPVALRVKPPSVLWPLHTSLMGPVAEALERQHGLTGQLRLFRHPVYSAVHAGRLSAPAVPWSVPGASWVRTRSRSNVSQRPARRSVDAR